MNTFTLERNNYRRKLIMLVKQHPILWNKTQENYNRNRPQKILAWHQISEQLDITVDKLRRTWENLRDQYRRDLKREVRFGFKSKWRFFSDMDFIRAMVSCKEHELKEHDFTDSESEPDVAENQNLQPGCSPVTVTPASAKGQQAVTTPTGSATVTLENSSASNCVPFQAIVLTKQWQPVAEDIAPVHNAPTNHSYSRTSPPNCLQPSAANCDSSKDCAKSLDVTLAFETVAKEEPDLDVEPDNTVALTEPQTPPPAIRVRNVGEFQEPCVSTSSQKQTRASTEEISDRPNTPANSHSQMKCETNLNVKDDDYYFVMSLLPSLRQIPRNRKFPLRIGIMSLIAKDLEEICKE